MLLIIVRRASRLLLESPDRTLVLALRFRQLLFRSFY